MKHKCYGPYEKLVKRPLDFLLALIAILLLSPVLLVVAVLVRVKLGKGVLFRQERPGRNGKIFRLYKFRTMTDARDASGNLLPDEQRMTGFGKKLRASSLDELPELLNVLKGNMAFIGPRPLLTRYLSLYNERQARRHEVRPGITGLAQIHGRNALGWEERFEWDVRYVDRVTFWGDVKIFFRTIKSVLKREGISGENSVTMTEFKGNEK